MINSREEVTNLILSKKVAKGIKWSEVAASIELQKSGRPQLAWGR